MSINNIPDKTIAVFPLLKEDKTLFPMDKLPNILEKSGKKRDWFAPNFYRCLPLTIGNSYGFLIKSEFDFGFEWNGGDHTDDITFYFTEEQEELSAKYPKVESQIKQIIQKICA